MSKTPASYITIGKIGAPYGVRGWIKIHSYTEVNFDIFKYQPWYLPEGEESYRMIEVQDGREHGKGLIAKFPGIDTPEDAALLTGKTIDIPRDALPTLKKDEYYWSDLIGLKVVNKNGFVFGTVINLIATGSNDVLLVKGDKEHGIPCLFHDVILHVDLVKREILVDWEPI